MYSLQCKIQIYAFNQLCSILYSIIYKDYQRYNLKFNLYFFSKSFNSISKTIKWLNKIVSRYNIIIYINIIVYIYIYIYIYLRPSLRIYGHIILYGPDQPETSSLVI